MKTVEEFKNKIISVDLLKGFRAIETDIKGSSLSQLDKTGLIREIIGARKTLRKKLEKSVESNVKNITHYVIKRFYVKMEDGRPKFYDETGKNISYNKDAKILFETIDKSVIDEIANRYNMTIANDIVGDSGNAYANFRSLMNRELEEHGEYYYVEIGYYGSHTGMFNGNVSYDIDSKEDWDRLGELSGIRKSTESKSRKRFTFMEKSTESKDRKLKEVSPTKKIDINKKKEKLKGLKKDYDDKFKVYSKAQHEDGLGTTKDVLRELNKYRSQITKLEDDIIDYFQTYEY